MHQSPYTYMHAVTHTHARTRMHNCIIAVPCLGHNTRLSQPILACAVRPCDSLLLFPAHRPHLAWAIPPPFPPRVLQRGTLLLRDEEDDDTEELVDTPHSTPNGSRAGNEELPRHNAAGGGANGTGAQAGGGADKAQAEAEAAAEAGRSPALHAAHKPHFLTLHSVLASGLVRCLVLDKAALEEQREVLRHAAEFGSLMMWYFVCDRTSLMPAGPGKSYSRDLFLFLFLVLTCVAIGSSMAAFKSPLLLNRPQTEEWKGWMQVRGHVLHVPCMGACLLWWRSKCLGALCGRGGGWRARGEHVSALKATLYLQWRFGG